MLGRTPFNPSTLKVIEMLGNLVLMLPVHCSIKKACPLHDENPVFAVKFIHKGYALRHGKIGAQQLRMEVTLHKHIGDHKNIISFFHTGEDSTWKWIAMELADHGDLFDKIEADLGLDEDIAQVYFTQLISAIGYMHSKGVAHRDIKPENLLLAGDGNLKIADFGLATLFEYNGNKKLSTTLCGSPPYIAPEVISCSKSGQTEGIGYQADLVDIWSCGIVLFVLLAGNTPWDSPTESSYEFSEYVATNGRTTDQLWETLPTTAVSLLRGMLKVDASSRFTLEDVRRHPWYTRENFYLWWDHRVRNTVHLAAHMLGHLRIDFTADPLTPSQAKGGRPRRNSGPRLSSTQPEMPGEDMLLDWDASSVTNGLLSSSQPAEQTSVTLDSLISMEVEPSLSQFGKHLWVTPKMSRKFGEIIPSRPLTRFFSTWAPKLLVPLLCEALHRLGVPVPTPAGRESPVTIRVVTKDQRMCVLNGKIVVEYVSEGLHEVEFVKSKGCPLEWRRFFKKVAILAKDAVYIPPKIDESLMIS